MFCLFITRLKCSNEMKLCDADNKKPAVLPAGLSIQITCVNYASSRRRLWPRSPR
ncbi:Uncharacterised protein [Vibrio cholerae]|nr:Uncharacterised protein [Vibrio cholerae]